jgi:hypothetical protein
MATKINDNTQSSATGFCVFSSWLSSRGMDRKEQTLYVRSGWLKRIAKGVYKIAGTNPTLYGAVGSFNVQLERELP